MSLTAAVVNWRIEVGTMTSFARRLDEMWPDADLVVFPECLVLETLGEGVRSEFWLERLASLAPEYEEMFRARRRSSQTVVCGTHFRGGVHGSLTLSPEGESFQPKNVLTQFELNEWGLRPPAPGLFPSPPLGTLICYDCEFPEAGRSMAEAGVLILAVPSFTEARQGFQRVRWSAHARAVENQIFVLHASLAGDLGGEPVPSTFGTSAILAPSVHPFPDTAVLAETKVGEHAVAEARLHLDALLECRESGDVRNWHDRRASGWPIR